MKKLLNSAIGLFLICIFCPVYGQDNPKDHIVQLTTSITESPVAISLKWNAIHGDANIYIYRKRKIAMDWGNAIATLPANATEYTDNNVEIGVEYTYKLIKIINDTVILTHVCSGIKCKEVEYRGKVILLVDSTFVDTLRNELIRYETDLIADGWDVLRKDISRNAPVRYVKSIIMDYYNEDTASSG
jgi:hypothetical protein